MTATISLDATTDTLSIDGWLHALYGLGPLAPARLVCPVQVEYGYEDGVASWLHRLYGVGAGAAITPGQAR